jgi:hypothetical protein
LLLRVDAGFLLQPVYACCEFRHRGSQPIYFVPRVSHPRKATASNTNLKRTILKTGCSDAPFQRAENSATYPGFWGIDPEPDEV